MTPQPLPLFGANQPRPARALLDGYGYDDTVELHDEKNPGHWHKARVIAVLPRAHVLTLRAGDRIISVQMPEFKHKLRRLA